MVPEHLGGLPRGIGGISTPPASLSQTVFPPQQGAMGLWGQPLKASMTVDPRTTMVPDPLMPLVAGSLDALGGRASLPRPHGTPLLGARYSREEAR